MQIPLSLQRALHSHSTAAHTARQRSQLALAVHALRTPQLDTPTEQAICSFAICIASLPAWSEHIRFRRCPQQEPGRTSQEPQCTQFTGAHCTAPCAACWQAGRLADRLAQAQVHTHSSRGCGAPGAAHAGARAVRGGEQHQPLRAGAGHFHCHAGRQQPEGLLALRVQGALTARPACAGLSALQAAEIRDCRGQGTTTSARVQSRLCRTLPRP